MKQRHGLAGIVATVAGIVLMVAGLPTGVGAGPRVSTEVTTQVVPLQNNTADAGDDCPDTGLAYWHFVIAPNDGTYAFVSMTLNLGAANPSFAVTGAMIIPNGIQLDNVFVAVPAGSALTDLLVSGSSAVITPDTPLDDESQPKFNLSHTCPGGSQETTTTAPTTTTTVAETTTTVAETTTTVAETTTTAAATTTTVAALPPIPPTTTTEQVAAEAPTVPASGALPVTGSTDTMWLELGGFLVLLGITMLALTRRRRPA